MLRPAVIQVEQQEQTVLLQNGRNRPDSRRPIISPTIVATLTSDSFLVRVAKAANLLNDPTFIRASQTEPYTDTEIAERMRGVVSATVRRVTRLIDVSATDTDPERAQLDRRRPWSRNSCAKVLSSGWRRRRSLTISSAMKRRSSRQSWSNPNEKLQKL